MFGQASSGPVEDGLVAMVNGNIYFTQARTDRFVNEVYPRGSGHEDATQQIIEGLSLAVSISLPFISADWSSSHRLIGYLLAQPNLSYRQPALSCIENTTLFNKDLACSGAEENECSIMKCALEAKSETASHSRISRAIWTCLDSPPQLAAIRQLATSTFSSARLSALRARAAGHSGGPRVASTIDVESTTCLLGLITKRLPRLARQTLNLKPRDLLPTVPVPDLESRFWHPNHSVAEGSEAMDRPDQNTSMGFGMQTCLSTADPAPAGRLLAPRAIRPSLLSSKPGAAASASPAATTASATVVTPITMAMSESFSRFFDSSQDPRHLVLMPGHSTGDAA
ncbi:unnamed protein product [Protopolystoma xenopodis]|uniref:Uncharacterized protein n=1 Tax=Protopolystoma xenopodis TaxID=117903 RepID=A0A448WEE6_9PLAT|nr:unnamed protein product [Protopolystoma xenopodis]